MMKKALAFMDIDNRTFMFQFCKLDIVDVH